MIETINLWMNFLYNEKLDSDKMDEKTVIHLVRLCEKMAETRGPKIRPYAEKIKSRHFVCETAIDLSMDLMAIKHKNTGKRLIGRGLLDVWLKVYKERFGSTIGTSAEYETKRRDIKTRLARDLRNEKSKNRQDKNAQRPHDSV